MAAEQIFHSDSYPRTLLDGLSVLYDRHAMVDCKLSFEDGESVMAHKCVLASASKYLQTQIEKGVMSSGTLIIKTVSSNDFLVLLHFMYTGELRLSQSSVWGITSAAAILEIPDAINLCKEFIDLAGGLVANTNAEQNDETDTHDEQFGEADAVNTLLNMKKDPSLDDEDTWDNLSNDYVDHVTQNMDHENYALPAKAQPKKRKKGRPKKRGNAKAVHTRTRSKNKSSKGGSGKVKVKQEAKDPDYEQSKHRKKKPVGSQTTPRKKKRDSLKSSSEEICVPAPKFKCACCPKKTFHYSSLQMHVRNHKMNPLYLKSILPVSRYNKVTIKPWQTTDGTASYQCSSCTEIFQSRLIARKHVAKIHRFTYTLNCAKCPRLFADSKKLLLHKVMKHHKAEIEPVECSLCSRSFMYEINLLKHMRTHGVESDVLPAKRVKYYCRHCQRMLTNKLVYISHLTQHGLSEREVQLEFTGLHEGDRAVKEETTEYKTTIKKQRYQCEICKKDFALKKTLSAHQKVVHEENNFSCLTCYVAFKTDEELQKHYLTAKRHNEFVTCSICGRQFSTKGGLRKHMQIHSGSRWKYRCSVEGCSKGFHTEELEQEHFLAAHLNCYSFSCPKEGCGKIFRHRETMQKHSRSCGSVIYCDECGKVFQTVSGLAGHVNTIHKNVVHCCECGKFYTRKRNLKLHRIKCSFHIQHKEETS